MWKNSSWRSSGCESSWPFHGVSGGSIQILFLPLHYLSPSRGKILFFPWHWLVLKLPFFWEDFDCHNKLNWRISLIIGIISWRGGVPLNCHEIGLFWNFHSGCLTISNQINLDCLPFRAPPEAKSWTSCPSSSSIVAAYRALSSSAELRSRLA